ncbi:EamA family transporter [Cohnella sp. CFH 77786]|uniref:DMT family transporter n=1 Tax=Cohnella sp. CFH 77786 TaxID=2662265 RepID=UPI001C609480|nr:DMT family transporter [Cohnella sp. CFH 77786]MBW5446281.1 EamA family transporter [Cohnella sp. CFH 77786]
MTTKKRSTGNPFPPSPPIAPIIPLLVGMIAISFAPILVRYSEAPASVQGMYRMLFTLLLMLPFGTKQFPGILRISGKDWMLLGFAGIFLGLHFLLWMESIDYTSIASSTIILSLEPVLVMIGAFAFFRDKPAKAAVLGLVVAIAGVVFVGSGDLGISRSAFVGDALSFFSTLAIAGNMLLAKRILTRVSSYLYSLIVFAVTFLFFAVYNLSAGVRVAGYPGKEWLIFLLLAIVPTVFGHMVFNWLLTYVSATTISMSVFAEPVGASLLAMVLFREMVTGFQIAGGILVIIGLLLYLKPGAAGVTPAASYTDGQTLER